MYKGKEKVSTTEEQASNKVHNQNKVQNCTKWYKMDANSSVNTKYELT